jgi:hypothetical protein
MMAMTPIMPMPPIIFCFLVSLARIAMPTGASLGMVAGV